MRDNVKISEILNYLNKNEYDYKFLGNQSNTIEGFSTLSNYKINTMTFVSTLNKFDDYKHLFENSSIKLIITGPDEKNFECFSNVIKHEYPKKLFFTLLGYFYDNEKNSQSLFTTTDNQHMFSYISKDADIGNNVKIGKGCVIEEGVSIGDNTVIHHNIVLKKSTIIGENCEICSGTIIGETGFNPLKDKNNKRDLVKHYGGVKIENNVHIGDGCTISRGTIDDTIIKTGVKMNKQVIVAHNVVIGDDTVITSPTFICGSVHVGKNCHIAATTIRNQCTIGDRAVLGLGSVVVKDVAAGDTVVGNPAKPLKKKDR